MQESLGSIDWNLANIFRLVAVIGEVIFVLDTVMLVAHRHYRINPMLREAKASGSTVVGAPPLWGSLYHAAFGLFGLNIAIATIQRMTLSGPSTIGVWTTPFVVIFAIVTTRMFARSYTEALREHEHHHHYR